MQASVKILSIGNVPFCALLWFIISVNPQGASGRPGEGPESAGPPPRLDDGSKSTTSPHHRDSLRSPENTRERMGTSRGSHDQRDARTGRARLREKRYVLRFADDADITALDDWSGEFNVPVPGEDKNVAALVFRRTDENGEGKIVLKRGAKYLRAGQTITVMLKRRGCDVRVRVSFEWKGDLGQVPRYFNIVRDRVRGDGSCHAPMCSVRFSFVSPEGQGHEEEAVPGPDGQEVPDLLVCEYRKPGGHSNCEIVTSPFASNGPPEQGGFRFYLPRKSAKIRRGWMRGRRHYRGYPEYEKFSLIKVQTAQGDDVEIKKYVGTQFFDVCMDSYETYVAAIERNGAEASERRLKGAFVRPRDISGNVGRWILADLRQRLLRGPEPLKKNECNCLERWAFESSQPDAWGVTVCVRDRETVARSVGRCDEEVEEVVDRTDAEKGGKRLIEAEQARQQILQAVNDGKLQDVSKAIAYAHEKWEALHDGKRVHRALRDALGLAILAAYLVQPSLLPQSSDVESGSSRIGVSDLARAEIPADRVLRSLLASPTQLVRLYTKFIIAGVLATMGREDSRGSGGLAYLAHGCIGSDISRFQGGKVNNNKLLDACIESIRTDVMYLMYKEMNRNDQSLTYLLDSMGK